MLRPHLPCVLLALAPLASAQPTCSTFATFADGLTPTRTLHVSPTGNNTTGDGTAARPYATITFALTHATPGTEVLINSGTYPGGTFFANLAGTPQAPIWLRGNPAQPRPIIQGGTNGLQLSKARYVIIENFEVRNASGNGINCDDGGDYANPNASGFLLFRNLNIHDIGTGNNDGLKLSGIYDFWVLDCDIARCGGAASGSLIDMVGCHRGLITRNFFHEASANAIQAKGGTSTTDIQWNRFYECGERAINIGGSTGLEFFRPPVSTTQPNAEARSIRVLSNVIIGATSALAYVGARDCTVSNNTIITPHNWLFRILQETNTTGSATFEPCGNNTFENNLVYFDRSDLSTHVNVGANTAPTTFTFRNNLWYAYDNPAASAPSLPTPEANRIAGINPRLATTAPQAQANYTPSSPSPAVAAAHAPSLIAADITGRCYSATPSIGAYEAARIGCGTADFNNDGDFGTDADIEAFFACLAGNCCPACWGADFNSDGDTGTDADIEAFFRILAGMNC